MEWLWELVTRNPWLFLILLGVVGQVFTPNPKKRQQARERERAARKQQQPPDTNKPRTDPDEVAARIRELFEGKSSTVVEDFEEDFEEAPVLAMPQPTSEIERSHGAVAGSFFDPHSIGEDRTTPALDDASWDPASVEIGSRQAHRQGHRLDPQAAVRAMLILGPPRALATYDEDPLLSRYQSLI